MSDFIELRTILLTLRRWWWLLFVGTLLGIGVGYGYSHLQTPIYRATTRLAVAQMVEANTLRFSDVETISQQLRTYADLAIRRPLLNAVIQELGLTISWQELQAQVRAAFQEESQLLTITVDDPVPTQAQRIADQVAQQLLLLNAADQKTIEYADQAAFVQTQVEEATRQLQEGQRQLDILRTIQGTSVITDTAPPLWAYWLSPANGVSPFDPSGDRTRRLAEEIDRLDRLMIEWDKSYNRWNMILQQIASFKSLTIIDAAYVEPRPVSPQWQLNTAAAGALGLMLALGIVGFMEGWNDTFRLSDNLSRFTKAPLLGAVRKVKGKTKRSKLLFNNDVPSVLNDYRLIHSKFQLMCTKVPKRILITSPDAGEGRSLLVANLGIVAAQFGYHTLIVDADWRNPTQHELFQIVNEKGLLQLLHNPKANTTVPMWSVNRLPNLTLLTSGGTHTQPVSAMATESALAVGWNHSERLTKVLTQLTGHADLILLDSSPLLTSADTVALAGQVDGVILVIEPGTTKQRALQEALFVLEQSQANLIGVVFNRTTIHLDNQFLNAVLPATLTRPALEGQPDDELIDHHHVTASTLTPATGVNGLSNGTAHSNRPLYGNHTANHTANHKTAADSPVSKPRKRVVLPMGQAHKKQQNASLPQLSSPPTTAKEGQAVSHQPVTNEAVSNETVSSQTEAAQMAMSQRAILTLAELGIDTITLHSQHSAADIPLMLPGSQNFAGGAQLRLELLPWLPTQPPAHEQRNGATATQAGEVGTVVHAQQSSRHFLEVMLDDIVLGSIPLKQGNSQIATLSIPALSEDEHVARQHTLRCRLQHRSPSSHVGAAAEVEAETIVVIRSTSAFIFTTEESIPVS